MSEENNTKTCNKCGKIKSLDDFYFRDKAKGIYRPECKDCRKAYLESRKDIIREQRRLGRIKNADKIKAQKHDFYLRHKDEILAKGKRRYAENAELFKAKQREYNETNRERINERQKEYYENNKDERLTKQKEYYRTHADERNAYNKRWAMENAEYKREYNRQYQQENKEKIAKQRKIYNANNRDKIRSWQRENKKRRLAEDPLFKLSEQIRTLVRNSLRRQGFTKRSRTQKILGCDFATFYEHLKDTWRDNYGVDYNGEPYHIDHIKPLATAKNEQDIINLCHYTNLQMLKPEDNLAKSDSLEWQFEKEDDDE